MSELTRGPWLLRFRIIEEETGVLLFLTSNGVGNLVTVEPEIHPPSERQIWYAVPVEGKEDPSYYTIIQDPASNCPPGLARVEDSNKVILSHPPGEWRPEQVPIETANIVYRIFPPPNPPPPISAYQLLGKEGQDAVIQTFAINLPPRPNPAWQFFQPDSK